MAEITIYVVAGLDDGQRIIDSTTDPWKVYAHQFQAGYESSSDPKAGAAARFLNVAIPAGVTITQANLVLTARHARSETVVNTRLRAQAHINPSTFVDDDGTDFDSRSWTTAYVNWDAIGTWVIDVEYTSPDIKACIQEVIELANWASGNPIVILWDDFEGRSTQASSRYRAADSEDAPVGFAPYLVIAFTPLSPSVTTDAATGITAVLATLNGTLDSDGSDPDGCDCSFEWGLNTNYGNTTATQNKTTGQSFEQALTELLPNTIYHYRAKATNGTGTSYGADDTFLTLANTSYLISGLEGTIRHVWEPSRNIYRLEVGLGGYGRGYRIIGFTHYEDPGPEDPPDFSGPLEVAPGPDVCAMAAEAYSRWQSTSMNPPIIPGPIGEQRAEETRARERYGAGTPEYRAWAQERMDRWAAERSAFEAQVNTLWNTYVSLNAACSLTKNARGGATGSRHSATIEELHRGRRPLKDWQPGQTETSVLSLARSPFVANSILKADTAGTPEALTVAEQRLVGRITSGDIAALTAAQTKTLLAILGTDVEVSELSGATYDDVQDYINFFGDRTLLSGGGITDNGNGTATVAAGTAWAKATDSDAAIGKFFDFSADNSVSLTDLITNYVYLDYNAGTPQIVVSTSITTHGFKQDHIHIATIFRNGTVLHYHEEDAIGVGRINIVDMYLLEAHDADRASGLVTTDNGSRTLSITAGVIYEGLNRHPSSPFTTPNAGTADATEANKLHDADGGFASTDVGKIVHNTTDDTYAKVTAFVDSGELTLDADIFVSGENYDLDIFSYWYTSDSGSTWTEVKGSTLISNTQYNNKASGLASLTSNRYGVHWLYVDLDGGNLFIVYGQGDYTINGAEEAGVPSTLPDIAIHYGVLIAKIILQEGQTSLEILYPWTTTFHSSKATDHGNLAGLGDDDHAIYLLADGTRNLTGNLTVSAGVTIDGIDIGAHDVATTGVHGVGANTLLHTGDVDDTPVNGATTAPASSNWAFDHVAAADPHTGYRLESADHTHQSAGAQAGQLDHGLALTGLLDDDHTQYQKESEKGAASGYLGLDASGYIPAVTLGGTVTINGQVLDCGAGQVSINTTGADQGLIVTSTQNSTGAAAFVGYVNSASPAAGDNLASFTSYGKDSVGNFQQYGAFLHKIGDPTSTSEDGAFETWLTFAGAWHQALRLSSAGALEVDASSGLGAATVGEYDKYDDARLLRQVFTRKNLEKLVDIGVADYKTTGSGYVIKLQSWNALVAGAIYQTRALVEALAQRVGISPRELIAETLALGGQYDSDNQLP